MRAVDLLPKLQRVRARGGDRWIASCPAHSDRSPSLSIRQAEGRVLLHCFGGCDFDSVARALRLQMSDLFDLSGQRCNKARRASGIPLADVLACIHDDVALALIFASDVAAGVVLSDDERLQVAGIVGRLYAALEVARG